MDGSTCSLQASMQSLPEASQNQGYWGDVTYFDNTAPDAYLRPSILEQHYGQGSRRLSLPHPTLKPDSGVEMPWKQYPRSNRPPPSPPPNSPRSDRESSTEPPSVSSYRIEADADPNMSEWTSAHESYPSSSVRYHSGYDGSTTSSTFTLDPIDTALQFVRFAYQEIRSVQQHLSPARDDGPTGRTASSHQETQEKEDLLHRLITKLAPLIAELLYHTNSLIQDAMHQNEGKIRMWGGLE